MKVIIYKDFTFEAAHKLPLVPETHKCSKLHGHSFKVRISVEDELCDQGWVIDYADIKSACGPVIEALDHTFLNEVPGLDNPTSENIAIWLWHAIKPKLAILSEIEVKETCNTGCIYKG
ncbi:6-carboxytetrahydropterin synthase QueD [Gammaproteobacteria bacterium]|nr:6-carboxytetrahydropterin synthase QueD [Gammaproteobacteria bacterium]MDC0128948.1 6-carboxytetrahydropterin synthase QueD [Gammaproteobacteria bacterium]